MKRTYLALSGLLLAGSALPATLPSLARAAGLFSSSPVDSSRFSVLARPVGESDWNLLVLEQLAPAPRCWTPQPDGLVDPSLNRFDYTGICSRYLDSNGYSLRIGDQDLATSYRLRLQQQGNRLLLQALSPSDPTVLVVGRAAVPHRDRDAFVAIQLDPGWELQRRSFGRQALNHLYFANSRSLRQLIAQADGAVDQPPLAALPPSPPSPPWRSPRRPQPARILPSADESAAVSTFPPGRTIALQVIPFQE
jgi:hypothetical protein